jgi:hypothetical protein
MWRVSSVHFVVGFVAATALSTAVLVVHPSATESLSRKFVYGLVGGLAGTVVSPLAFDLSGVNIGLYRTIVLGMVFVGMACGWSAAVVISGRLIPKRSD